MCVLLLHVHMCCCLWPLADAGRERECCAPFQNIEPFIRSCCPSGPGLPRGEGGGRPGRPAQDRLIWPRSGCDARSIGICLARAGCWQDERGGSAIESRNGVKGLPGAVYVGAIKHPLRVGDSPVCVHIARLHLACHGARPQLTRLQAVRASQMAALPLLWVIRVLNVVNLLSCWCWCWRAPQLARCAKLACNQLTGARPQAALHHTPRQERRVQACSAAACSPTHGFSVSKRIDFSVSKRIDCTAAD